MAVYMPVLEFAILLQFAWYARGQMRAWPWWKWFLVVVGVVVWIAIIVLELVDANLSSALQWGATALWSLETIPQIRLNWLRQTTEAQSSSSLCLVLLGKMTDCGSAYLLVMPPQTRILAFFSSAAAYFNATQFLFYPRAGQPAEGTGSPSESESASLLLDGTKGIQDASPQDDSPRSALRSCAIARYVGIAALLAAILGFAVALLHAFHWKAWALAFPGGLALALAAGYTEVRCRRARCPGTRKAETAPV